ncbi:MAG: hypothetical protein Aurels2KO_28950 [Aureliella sp.]
MTEVVDGRRGSGTRETRGVESVAGSASTRAELDWELDVSSARGALAPDRVELRVSCWRETR